ncbi:MAG: hypothetical protein JSV12_03815 [Candidatus Bathyarchaeota archaeon]|nr:MAG: hypothetical protein JSV12_03815 [Candidatus Bathyarchaeota archaeon]
MVEMVKKALENLLSDLSHVRLLQVLMEEDKRLTIMQLLRSDGSLGVATSLKTLIWMAEIERKLL